MTDSKVVRLWPPGATQNPDVILEQAIGEYESVVVIGYDKEGVLDARASMNIDRKDILWMVEMFKDTILFADPEQWYD